LFWNNGNLLKFREVPESDSLYNKKVINPLDLFSRCHVLDTALSSALIFRFLTDDALDIDRGGLG
jgi:hypothetical protein